MGSRVRPLAGEGSLAVDGEAVRRRLGAWVAARPPAARRGIDAIWRDALLVCDQIVVLARTTLGTPAPLWQVDVPLPADTQGLARAAGLPPRVLHDAVDALIGAEILDGVSQIGSERVVRVRSEVLTDAPVLAAVRWDVVRDRLADRDAPIARLIVRELARRTTLDARAQGHFVSASQRELADAVGYSKASMRRHLDALIDAGVIVSRSRDRANSWHRLQPLVFDEPAPRAVARPIGADSSPAAAPVAAGAPSSATRSTSAWPVPLHERVPPSAVVPAAPVAPSPARPLTPALTLEVNGVRVAIPAGVELTLEQDDDGAIWYRAGSLRLGPVRFG